MASTSEIVLNTVSVPPSCSSITRSPAVDMVVVAPAAARHDIVAVSSVKVFPASASGEIVVASLRLETIGSGISR